jgi:hypothetical protein
MHAKSITKPRFAHICMLVSSTQYLDAQQMMLEKRVQAGLG